MLNQFLDRHCHSPFVDKGRTVTPVRPSNPASPFHASPLAHDVKEAAYWVEELAWYKQQYDQLVITYNALAHVTDLSSAAYAVGGLTRNFMPEANAIPQLMSDAAGLWGTAGSFQSYDLYYQSHVLDKWGTEMDRRQVVTSNAKAMAE